LSAAVFARCVLGNLSPPGTRIHADDPAEYSRQMRLIAHSAIESNLGQRRVRAQQEFLATSDALPRYVGQRRLAEALPERSKEMTGTQRCCMREVGSPNARTQVRRDVRRHAPFLPKRETAARCERTSHLLASPDAAPSN
jgi:hypothetical protein